jgi:hypothetical protein
MKSLVSFVALVSLACAASVARAQSPNTSSIIVLINDQSGAMVADAKVSVINNQTGAVRDVVSGADGAATISALPLNGTYTVSVA